MTMSTSPEIESLPDKSRSLRTRSILKRLETERNKNTPKQKQDLPSKARPKGSRSLSTMSRYRRKTANAKERDRMRHVNEAFLRLKCILPLPGKKEDEGKETKVSVLRFAIVYINALQHLLEDSNRGLLDSAMYYREKGDAGDAEADLIGRDEGDDNRRKKKMKNTETTRKKRLKRLNNNFYSSKKKKKKKKKKPLKMVQRGSSDAKMRKTKKMPPASKCSRESKLNRLASSHFCMDENGNKGSHFVPPSVGQVNRHLKILRDHGGDAADDALVRATGLRRAFARGDHLSEPWDDTTPSVMSQTDGSNLPNVVWVTPEENLAPFQSNYGHRGDLLVQHLLKEPSHTLPDHHCPDNFMSTATITPPSSSATSSPASSSPSTWTGICLDDVEDVLRQQENFNILVQ